MPIPANILHRVELFDQNLDAYRSGNYNEAQVRREFIDPFFEALGWDIDNKQGYAEAYKDVIHEDAIKVGGSTKAPDYCFRVGGVRKFFVEAKKPSVKIKTDIHPAIQLRRYGWSAKLPLSILTDFEEFAVYDCSIEPKKNDSPSTARLLYFTYKDYPERWDEIASVFSRDAIPKGSFDKYAIAAKSKRGTSEVDTAFLREIETWRLNIAENLVLRNNSITVPELNFAVQRIIDRIIFLRICEDRGIEEYERLKSLLNGKNTYSRLVQLFHQADDRYNSGLFHFRQEKNRAEAPDKFSTELHIDDLTLTAILRRLYYPDSPYEFSVLSADILGNVYEQFLGKVISIGAGRGVTITQKPEVKKAGGVYYTPAYIVEYIVRNTVGSKLGDATQYTGKKHPTLRICDPACGSGSFLLGAYQYLLDWYLTRYTIAPDAWTKGKNPTIYRVSSGNGYKLSATERKRILLEHIYGVDIDSQAVEVTKLSLLLKVLEGETDETIASRMRLFHERALPDLDANIKCGNSLIGTEFYKDAGEIATDEILRVNPFSWHTEFAQAFTSDGFDCIIGNPPYIRIQALKEWAPIEVEIYKKDFAAADTGSYDIYVVFIERALSLVNKDGLVGYILPHKFFNTQYGEPIRRLLANGKYVSHIVHFGEQQVFAKATTYTCLLFLNKAGSDDMNYVEVDDLNVWQRLGTAKSDTVAVSKITEKEWNFSIGDSSKLLDKLNEIPTKLGNICSRIFQGLITGCDKVFILKTLDKNRYYSESTGSEHVIESEIMHPLCKGSVNLRRYHVLTPTKAILFPYLKEQDKMMLLAQDSFIKKFPQAWQYLESNRDTLESREHGKWKHDKWYSFGRTQNLKEMEQRKILTPSLAKEASFTLDKNDYYYFVGSGGGGGGGYGIVLKDEYNLTYEFILGLLNSKLADYYIKKHSSLFRGKYYAYSQQYINQVPIITEGPSQLMNDIGALSAKMLLLHKQLTTVHIPQEIKSIEGQIEATDRHIDQLVYSLYDLTPDEIGIVEGN